MLLLLFFMMKAVLCSTNSIICVLCVIIITMIRKGMRSSSDRKFVWIQNWCRRRNKQNIVTKSYQWLNIELNEWVCEWSELIKTTIFKVLQITYLKFLCRIPWCSLQEQRGMCPPSVNFTHPIVLLTFVWWVLLLA